MSSEPALRPRLVFLLTQAQRRLHAAIQGDGDAGSAARAGVLMVLGTSMEGIRMKEVGRQLGLGASSLSGLIDRMARDGLVERRLDPADSRGWMIVPTDAGHAARNRAVQQAGVLNQRLCDGFDADELAIVARWLETVGTRFRKGTTE